MKALDGKQKRELSKEWAMTVQVGLGTEVSEFDSIYTAVSYYEDIRLNPLYCGSTRGWMKTLWARKKDGHYGRIAYQVTQLRATRKPEPQGLFLATEYFDGWDDLLIDEEAQQILDYAYCPLNFPC